MCASATSVRYECPMNYIEVYQYVKPIGYNGFRNNPLQILTIYIC